MKPHKWAKEIKAWADGAEIEWRWITSIEGTADNWRIYQKDNELTFFEEGVEFRIKPQPKEPQYLYVYKDCPIFTSLHYMENYKENYMGKIKLEDE